MTGRNFGSLAENPGKQSRTAGRQAGRDGGSLRPLSAGDGPLFVNDKGRSSMTNGRSSGQAPWEVRLGAFQVVVWLGLAIGSLVGAYFVGFFSGQSVGFESARSASGVEVAKLAINEDLPVRSSQSVSAIYDRLNEPALLDKSDTPPVEAKGKQPVEEPQAVRVAKEIKSAELARGSDDSKVESPRPSMIESEDDLFNAPIGGQDVDSQQKTPAEQKIAEQQKTDESTVRFLGQKSDGNAEHSEKDLADKTLGAMLEERLAKARTEGAKLPPKVEAEVPPAEVLKGASQDLKPVTKTAAQDQVKPPAAKLADEGEKEKNSKTDANFVKRIIPPGYFAQVAAPKSRTDAEGVAKKLKKSGFPVVVEAASVKGEEYYRVLVGPEQNRVHADRLVEQLRGERYLSGPAFVRQVK